ARSFGGEDYTGFHTMMAFGPSYAMSKEMPKGQEALPVLKVIHRNARRLQETGAYKNEVLHPVTPQPVPSDKKTGQARLEAADRKDMDDAERTFAARCQGKPDDALNELLLAVQDCLEVHRIVLPYRAWDMVGLIGQEHAHTLLRQSVHYCVKN